MTIDNFELIKPLLKFDNEDIFYFIQVLQRTKEHPELGKNSNLIKAYYISSLEYLDKKKSEIIKLAETFNGRVYIHLNKRDSYKIALELMEDLAHNINGNQYRTAYHLYDSVCGRHPSREDKTWVVDVDTKERKDIEIIRSDINNCEPNRRQNKIIIEVPTKNGVHLISTPFNSQEFGLIHKDIEIHKNNPSILYIP